MYETGELRRGILEIFQEAQHSLFVKLHSRSMKWQAVKRHERNNREQEIRAEHRRFRKLVHVTWKPGRLELPTTCPVCQAGFINNTNLSNHIRMKHETQHRFGQAHK